MVFVSRKGFIVVKTVWDMAASSVRLEVSTIHAVNRETELEVGRDWGCTLQRPLQWQTSSTESPPVKGYVMSPNSITTLE